MLNGSRIKDLERKQADTDAALAIMATAIERSERAHRKPDLSKPRTLELRPLVAFRDEAIRSGLQRLFDKKWFDHCAFDNLCTLARVYPPRELAEQVRLLHCVHWNTMEPEYRDQIQQHIIACFVPIEVEEEAVEG